MGSSRLALQLTSGSMGLVFLTSCTSSLGQRSSWVLIGYALAAGGIAGFVGFVELLQRYSVGTNAKALLLEGLAALFVVLHVVAGIATYFALPLLDSDFATQSLGRALAAGFGALAILRLSFLNVGTGDQKLSIGPGAMLDILFAHIDQRIDQNRAKRCIDELVPVVKGIRFDRAARDLTAMTVAALERMPAAEAKRLGEEVSAINTRMEIEQSKVLTLAITLRKFGGLGMLQSLICALKDELTKDVPKDDTVTIRAQAAIDGLPDAPRSSQSDRTSNVEVDGSRGPPA